MAGRLTRRAFLAHVAIGIGAASVLNACGANAPTAPAVQPTPQAGAQAQPQGSTTAGTVKYWQYNADIAETEKKIISKLTEKNSKIQVQYEAIPWQQYWQKLNASLVSGDAPDVWNTAPTFYYEYVKRNQLTNLDDYVKRDLNLDNYFKKTLGQWQVPIDAGPRFGVPRNWVITVLYYNQTMFDEAKVAYPNDNWTWDDMLEAGKKLTKTTSDPKTAQFGLNLGVDHSNFSTTVYADGGRVLDAELKKCVLDQYPQATERLQWFVDAIQTHKVSPPPGFFEGLGNPFQTGKVAMTVSITAGMGNFRKITAFKWDIAKVPKGKKERLAYGGPDGLVLTKTTKVPDAAWELTKFLIGKDAGIEFYTAWGGIPFNRDLAIMPEFLNARPGDIKVAIDSEPFMFADYNPGWGEWNTALRDEVTAAVLNKKPAAEAIKSATQSINAILQKNQ